MQNRLDRSVTASVTDPVVRPAAPSRPPRRRLLQGAAAAGLAAAAPAVRAQSQVTGEIAFASFEWNLPHTGSVLRAISKSFSEKFPNARVREIPIPAAGYADQILTQLTAGTPPDIFRIDDPQIAMYIDRNWLLPLDDALKAAGVDASRFAAAGRDAQKDGRTYAVVYQTNARQLIYNRALLQAAGLNAPPSTPAELEQAILKTTQRDKGIFGYTFASKSGEVSQMFNSLGPTLVGFGAHFTTPDGRPNATDPRMVEALRFVKRIWDADAVPRGLDGPSATKLMFEGKVAMALTGSFVFGAATPEVKPLLASAPSPLPGALVRASSWYGVSAKGRNPTAAMAWLMHMLSAEGQAKIVEVERVVPALPHLVPASVYQESPWFRPFVDGSSKAISYLPPGLGPRAFGQIKVIGEEIENILYRSKAADRAMADLQRALEASLR